MPSLCSARNYKQHICIHAGKFVLFLASIEAAPYVHPALLFVVSLFDLRAVAKTASISPTIAGYSTTGREIDCDCKSH